MFLVWKLMRGELPANKYKPPWCNPRDKNSIHSCFCLQMVTQLSGSSSLKTNDVSGQYEKWDANTPLVQQSRFWVLEKWRHCGWYQLPSRYSPLVVVQLAETNWCCIVDIAGSTVGVTLINIAVDSTLPMTKGTRKQKETQLKYVKDFRSGFYLFHTWILGATQRKL